jgi:hypothetical protein
MISVGEKTPEKCTTSFNFENQAQGCPKIYNSGFLPK